MTKWKRKPDPLSSPIQRADDKGLFPETRLPELTQYHDCYYQNPFFSLDIKGGPTNDPNAVNVRVTSDNEGISDVHHTSIDDAPLVKNGISRDVQKKLFA